MATRTPKGPGRGAQDPPECNPARCPHRKIRFERVTVATITHTPPAKDSEAIELPIRVKQALGLDDERSWVVLDEVNQFTWPGFYIRPVPGTKTRFSYGFIPPRLYDAIIARILELAAARRVAEVSRD